MSQIPFIILIIVNFCFMPIFIFLGSLVDTFQTHKDTFQTHTDTFQTPSRYFLVSLQTPNIQQVKVDTCGAFPSGKKLRWSGGRPDGLDRKYNHFVAPSCKLKIARFLAQLRIQDGAECGRNKNLSQNSQHTILRGGRGLL